MICVRRLSSTSSKALVDHEVAVVHRIDQVVDRILAVEVVLLGSLPDMAVDLHTEARHHTVDLHTVAAHRSVVDRAVNEALRIRLDHTHLDKAAEGVLGCSSHLTGADYTWIALEVDMSARVIGSQCGRRAQETALGMALSWEEYRSDESH